MDIECDIYTSKLGESWREYIYTSKQEVSCGRDKVYGAEKDKVSTYDKVIKHRCETKFLHDAETVGVVSQPEELKCQS